ncbi:MAG TPA: MlaD family protein [Verrucomicrobiae bacterium]|jgi:phospholipid/cholesterol/gamma-HCH transport system substrate-binding protein|nr:MlaD family protein [Verrucomicrobiae bacterium]
MKDSVESRLGIFFALAIIFILIILESLGGFSIFKRGFHVHAMFKNVHELKSGDPVKMAGVPIGSVQKIQLTNGMAEVTVDLDRSSEVRTDSRARVGFTGLMAQNYVSIDFGTPDAPPATDGIILQTVDQPDLEDLMTKLDNVASGVENLTRSFSGEKIDNLLGPFTDFLKDTKTNLETTIANIKTISDRIKEGQGTVGKLINEDTLYVNAQNSISNLQNTAGDIDNAASKARELLTNANDVVLDVRAGKGTIGKLLTDDTLFREATGSLTNLHQILIKINDGQGTVGQLINDPSALKNIKLSLQKLDKATESLEDTGPLSVLGTLASFLF